MGKLALLATAAMAAVGCSSAPVRPPGAQRNVEVFTAGRPDRPFTEVCRLNLYLDKVRSGEPELDELLPEVKRRAALCGADAVIDLDWSTRGGGEAIIYRVKAVGIAFAKAGEGLGPAREREVEVLGPDSKKTVSKVCNLDLYVEKTTTGEPALDDVLPEVKRQARLCGANAVADVQWTLQGAGQTAVYHVTAAGVVATEAGAAAVPPGGAADGGAK